MFTIAVIQVALEPETKALITRLLDFLEAKQQAQLDAMATAVDGLTGRLRTSAAALKGAIDRQK